MTFELEIDMRVWQRSMCDAWALRDMWQARFLPGVGSALGLSGSPKDAGLPTSTHSAPGSGTEFLGVVSCPWSCAAVKCSLFKIASDDSLHGKDIQLLTKSLMSG